VSRARPPTREGTREALVCIVAGASTLPTRHVRASRDSAWGIARTMHPGRAR